MIDDLKRFERNEEAEFAMLGFRKVIGATLAHEWDRTYDLIMALKDNRHRKAFEPKDMVFWRMGIVTGKVNVQYEKCASETYTDAALHYIRKADY